MQTIIPSFKKILLKASKKIRTKKCTMFKLLNVKESTPKETLHNRIQYLVTNT